jgi:hypothetical protein
LASRSPKSISLVMPDPVHLSMAVDDFDLGLLPADARHIGSAEFTLAATRLLEQDFAAVGGQAEVMVGLETIEVDWTPPPTGGAHAVSLILDAIHERRLRGGPLLLRLWLRGNPDHLDRLARWATALTKSVPELLPLAGTILECAVDIAPESAAARKGMGIFLVTTGQAEAATQYLRAATIHDSNDVEAWLRLGDALVVLARMAEAEQAYRKVVDLDRWGLYGDEAAEKLLVSSAATFFNGQVHTADWDSAGDWMPSRSTAGKVCAVLQDWETGA